MLPSIFGENLLDDLWRTDFDRDWFNMDRELYGKHAKNLMKTDVREGVHSATVVLSSDPNDTDIHCLLWRPTVDAFQSPASRLTAYKYGHNGRLLADSPVHRTSDRAFSPRHTYYIYSFRRQ